MDICKKREMLTNHFTKAGFLPLTLVKAHDISGLWIVIALGVLKTLTKDMALGDMILIPKILDLATGATLEHHLRIITTSKSFLRLSKR